MGPCHIVGLYVPTADVSPATVAWLEADLESARGRGDTTWTVVFQHQPLFAHGSSHPSDHRVRSALAITFERHGVDLHLSAHDQCFERTFPVRAAHSVPMNAFTALDEYATGRRRRLRQGRPAGSAAIGVDFSLFADRATGIAASAMRITTLARACRSPSADGRRSRFRRDEPREVVDRFSIRALRAVGRGCGDRMRNRSQRAAGHRLRPHVRSALRGDRHAVPPLPLGLRPLGWDVWYVEDSLSWPYDPAARNDAPDPSPASTGWPGAGRTASATAGSTAALFRTSTLLRGRRGDACRLYRDVEVALNVTGAQEIRDEQARIPSLVYVQSDPSAPQVDVANGQEWMRRQLDAHCATSPSASWSARPLDRTHRGFGGCRPASRWPSSCGRSATPGTVHHRHDLAERLQAQDLAG